jgi:hypothetical protein
MSLIVDLNELGMSFHVHIDSATSHVTSFMKLMSDLGVVHEDTMMKFVVASLVDEAMD